MDLSFLGRRSVQVRIAAGTLACAVLGGVIGITSPKWYQSSVTLVPARAQRSGGIASLLGGEIGALAGGLEGSAWSAPDTARIAAVLQGTAVTDAVIEKFDLRARYSTKYQEDARDRVWRHCSVRTQPKPNIVQLTCEDRDPRFVQALVAYFAGYGNEVFRRVNASAATEEVKYLDRRIAELRQASEEASTRMREFQERHKVIDLDSQARSVVSSVAALQSQRRAKLMDLEYARSFAAPDEAVTRQLETQLSIVDENLRDLETPRETGPGHRAGATRSPPQSMVLPAVLAVPKLRAEYEAILRDRKVAEASLIYALDRLEGAKAAEARDVSTFMVLDPPVVPTRKSRPSGAMHALAGAFLGLAGSLLLAWRQARRPGTAARA